MSFVKIKVLFIGVLFIAAFFIQGCATSQTVEKKEKVTEADPTLASEEPHTAELDSIYSIKIGDEVEVSVWEESDFNTTTTVSNMGTIVVPLIGEIEAAGKTQNQLERQLRQELSKYIRGEINLTVAVRNTDSLKVSVLGMVIRPDNYPVVEETSIFKVLSMAGGTTDQANINSVRIYREESNPGYTELDIADILEKGETKSAAKIYPGDIVYVPPKEKNENVVREISGFLRDAVLLFGIFRVVN